jgi:pyrroloquinoline quinone (PQQ) biosynthesis protein C
MFVLEGMGGSHAGGVSAAIDRALGLKGKGTYFLAGHGEADAVHSEELFEVVSAHITTNADVEAFQTVADRSLELYIEILDGAIIGKAGGIA